jgi:hypothetical protein
MRDEQQVTLSDVAALAGDLSITFVDGEQAFDLDTAGSALFGLHGTYQRSDLGVEAAFGDLVRYRDREAQR